MKHLFSFLILFSLSCEINQQSVAPPPVALPPVALPPEPLSEYVFFSIHLTEGYYWGKLVSEYIDDSLIYQGYPATGFSTGFAKSVTLSAKRGTRMVKIVYDTLSKDTTLNLQDSLWLLVGIAWPVKIRFITLRVRPRYS